MDGHRVDRVRLERVDPALAADADASGEDPS
jgi:hypothetical protein